jgi:hypothetical protein
MHTSYLPCNPNTSTRFRETLCTHLPRNGNILHLGRVFVTVLPTLNMSISNDSLFAVPQLARNFLS